MDRQITMFLALLLFASSVLASAGNAENVGVPTVTWSYWVPGWSGDKSHRSSYRPYVESKSIENAYQLFLDGGPKQFQITTPAGFRPFSRRFMHGKAEKVTIDFGLMQQYLVSAVRAVRRSGASPLEIGILIKGFVRSAYGRPDELKDVMGLTNTFLGDIMCPGPVRWLWFRSDHHETNEWAEYEEKFQNPIESAYQLSLARDSPGLEKVGENLTFDFNKWSSKHDWSWPNHPLPSREHPVPIWRKCLPSTGATATNGNIPIQFVQPDSKELFEESEKPKNVPKKSSASTGNNEPTRFIFVAFPLMIVFGLAVYCAYKAKYISL
eukprot:128161_1